MADRTPEYWKMDEIVDDLISGTWLEGTQGGSIYVDAHAISALAAPLEAANARIKELEANRDRPWTYRISIPDGNPTWPGCVNYDLRLVDTGYSDCVRLMESKGVNEEIADLRDAVRVLAVNLAEYVMHPGVAGQWINCANNEVISNPTARAAIEAARAQENSK